MAYVAVARAYVGGNTPQGERLRNHHEPTVHLARNLLVLRGLRLFNSEQKQTNPMDSAHILLVVPAFVGTTYELLPTDKTYYVGIRFKNH